MDWFPIVFFTFKIIVVGTGMFFAVKWHYDQGQKEKKLDKRALIRAASLTIALFLLALLVLGLATFFAIRKLGLDFGF